MVSQVGFNTGFNTNSNNINFANPFGANPNDYSNDFMMPQALLNFQSQSNNQALQAEQASQTQQPTQQQTQQPKNQLSEKDKQLGNMTDEQFVEYMKSQYPDVSFTQKGNPYMKTSFTKKSGALIGFLAPLATGLYKVVKGAKVSDIFKLKELAVRCPVLAGVGFAIGVAIDGIINSMRAKSADNPQNV